MPHQHRKKMMFMILNILLLSTTVNAQHVSGQSPVNWAIPFPDLTKSAAGYQQLDGAAHCEPLYTASDEHGQYSHHPQIISHNGALIAAWSNHRYGEDGPGQRVLGAISVDGITWQPWFELFPSHDQMRKPEEKGRALTANGWAIVDGTLYAVAEVHDNIGFTNPQGTVLSEVRKEGTRRRARKGWGRIARSVAPDGALGPIFWLCTKSPKPLYNRFRYGDMRDPRFEKVGSKILSFLANPLHQPAWDFVDPDFHRNAADGHKQVEPTVYRRADSALIKLTRDAIYTHRMYVALSRDEGRTWSLSVPTDIPDSPSKSKAGALPDGRTFLLGNLVSEPFDRAKDGHYWRDPLVLALSDDGVTFDRAWAFRTSTIDEKSANRGRGRSFQYPSFIIANNFLYVIYSIDKHDVGVSFVNVQMLE